MIFSENLRGISGVYCAIHRDTGRCYVGSSVDIYKRRQEHLRFARIGSPTRFHVAIRTLGADSFDFEILERCDQKYLLERERFYIALMGAAEVDGFNCRSNPCATYGFRRDSVSRARTSAALAGKAKSEEHKRKLSEYRMGRTSSEETRARQSAALKGRVFSPETLQKQSETRRLKFATLGPEYCDLRKPIIATDSAGKLLHLFASLLDAVDGLKTPNSSLRYYLRTGKLTPKGMLLYYATIHR